MIFPDLSGTWSVQQTVLRRTGPLEKPTFSDIVKNNATVLVEQQEQFFIVTLPANPPFRPVEEYQLGLLSKVNNNIDNFWQITLADYDDSGIFNLTIKEYETKSDCECEVDIDCHKEPQIRPTVLEGYYVESGFSVTNPSQNQAIGKVIWTRA